jgi:hypothetical protein
MKIHWHFALLSLLISGTQALAFAQGNLPPKSEAFTILAQGNESGIEQQRFETIKDAVAFQKLWDLNFQTVSPKPPTPKVDFSNEMVIAAFAGTKSTGGYELTLTKINNYSDSVQIDLSLLAPDGDCMVSGALTQPFLFVKSIKFTDKPVHFNLELKTHACGAIK